MSFSLLLGFGYRARCAPVTSAQQPRPVQQRCCTGCSRTIESPDSEVDQGCDRRHAETLDPHSVFLPEAPSRWTSSSTAILGHRCAVRHPDNKIVVISPLEGHAGLPAGIREGDKIIEIDGKPPKKGINNDDVFKLPAAGLGPPSWSRSSARRAGTCTSIEARRSRSRAFRTPAKIPSGRRLRASSGSRRRPVTRPRSRKHARGMKSLLIDLRSNSGGLLPGRGRARPIDSGQPAAFSVRAAASRHRTPTTTDQPAGQWMRTV